MNVLIAIIFMALAAINFWLMRGHFSNAALAKRSADVLGKKEFASMAKTARVYGFIRMAGVLIYGALSVWFFALAFGVAI